MDNRVKDDMIRVLAKNGLNISKACRELGITNNQHYDWLKEDPEYVKAIKDLGDKNSWFLNVLSSCRGNTRQACIVANISEQTIWYRRRANEDFDKRYRSIVWSYSNHGMEEFRKILYARCDNQSFMGEVDTVVNRKITLEFLRKGMIDYRPYAKDVCIIMKKFGFVLPYTFVF